MPFRVSSGVSSGSTSWGRPHGHRPSGKEGDPEFWFTARRWTTEQLDAAAHLSDLTPGDTVWVNLDHGQHGIGSQSCGPGPLPRYRLRAEPAEFSFVFSPLD